MIVPMLLSLFAQLIVYGQGCQPGELPAFHLGFARLQQELGGIVGEPLTCEFPVTSADQPRWSGDVAQGTTTGLAYYRKTINAPIFYDANLKRHWGLLPEGIGVWDGPAIEPPADVFILPYDWQCTIGVPVGDFFYKRCPAT